MERKESDYDPKNFGKNRSSISNPHAKKNLDKHGKSSPLRKQEDIVKDFSKIKSKIDVKGVEILHENEKKGKKKKKKRVKGDGSEDSIYNEETSEDSMIIDSETMERISYPRASKTSSRPESPIGQIISPELVSEDILAKLNGTLEGAIQEVDGILESEKNIMRSPESANEPEKS